MDSFWTASATRSHEVFPCVSFFPFGMKTPTQSSCTVPSRTKNSAFGHISLPLSSQSATRMSSRETAMGLSCATSQSTSRSSATALQQLLGLLRNHRAWATNQPTAWGVPQLLREHPATTVVTCTRAASAKVNQLATQVLFHDRHKQPLGPVPLDFESKEENFGPSGELHEGRMHAQEQTDIFQGQRVFLTRNLDKDHDFVNSMAAIVDAFEEVANCLMLTTSTGRRLAVHLYTQEVEEHDNVTFFLVRNGYACTI